MSSGGQVEKNTDGAEDPGLEGRGLDYLRKRLAEAEEALGGGDLDGAGEAYGRLREEFPQSGEVWEGLARVDFIRGSLESCAGNYREALERCRTLGLFQRIYHLAPTDHGKLLTLAKALSGERQYEEALKFAEKLLEMSLPRELRQEALALKENLLGREEIAGKALAGKEFERSGGRIKAVINGLLILILLAALGGLGYFLYLGYNVSISSGKKAMEEAAALKESFRQKERGEELVIQKLKKAERIFVRLSARKEGRGQALYHLGRTYREMEDFYRLVDPGKYSREIQECAAKAGKNLELSIAADPDSPEAYLEMAEMLFARGRYGLAGEYAEKALRAAGRINPMFKARVDQVKERADRFYKMSQEKEQGDSQAPAGNGPVER